MRHCWPGLYPTSSMSNQKTGRLTRISFQASSSVRPGQSARSCRWRRFGMPLDLARWEVFRSRTGVAVVVDAAAAFDSLVPGVVPSVVSLHATKVLGIGEGGFVISTDPALAREVRMRANFGFYGSRHARAAAFNAKLSEYHAAVGHAALDEWTQARVEWNDAIDEYRRALNGSNCVSLQRGVGETWVSSTCMLGFNQPVADRIEQRLTRSDIETRRWWGAGAHMHPATASLPRARCQ